MGKAALGVGGAGQGLGGVGIGYWGRGRRGCWGRAGGQLHASRTKPSQFSVEPQLKKGDGVSGGVS